MRASARPRPVLVVAPVDRDAAARLSEAAPLAVLADVDGPFLTLTPLDGGPSRTEPVDAMLGLVALTKAGLAAADKLAVRLEAATGLALPVHDLAATSGQDRPLHLARAYASALEAALVEAHRASASLARGLAGLRREHETLLERYTNLGQAVVTSGAQPVWPVCRIEPVGDPVELGGDAELGSEASVLLPFSVAGLASLSLDIVAVDGVDSLSLVLESEDGRDLARWRRAGDALEPGWAVFTTPFALIEPPASGRLRLSVEGAGFLQLGTGAPHPSPDLQVLGSTGARAESPLALRAEASTPGLRPPRPGARAAVRAPAESFASALQLQPFPDDYPGLVGEAEDGGLLVQPISGSTTEAMLPDAVPAGAFAAEALVIVAHADGPTVEFALAAGLDAADDPETLTQAQPGFSGWVAAPAMTPTALTLLLDPGPEPLDLHVLTRIDASSGHDWCARAVVRSLRLHGGAPSVDLD